jgi:hypothetical protein
MTRMRGWGLLLAVALPLLIFFSWSRLGDEKARINLERYAAWAGSDAGALMQPLRTYFLKQQKPAAAGDLELPAIPAQAGVKSWALQADSTLLVTLDAKVEGHAVRLRYVPIVRSATGIFYDCVSDTSPVYVGRLCQAEVLKSGADVAAQLDANAQVLATLPPVQSASGTALAAGTPTGSVVVVPAAAQDLNHCGFQCVQPQSCVTPRPLACAQEVSEGNSGHQDVAATPDDVRGSQFATRSAADAACAQALGTGYRVAQAGSLGGVFKLAGGKEYWVHNDLRPEQNCWPRD